MQVGFQMIMQKILPLHDILPININFDPNDIGSAPNEFVTMFIPQLNKELLFLQFKI
jgi:hypothetical protein